jgi:phage FluMu protein Com
MKEFRCTKCGKLLANIFNSDAIAVMVGREAIEQVELHHNSNHIKRIEIKCPRCKTLNTAK